MPNELHTIRFKRQGVEFEMTGSKDEVSGAWSTLESAVVAAFSQAQNGGVDVVAENGNHSNGDEPTKKRSRPKRSAKPHSGSGDERADVTEKLANTPIDGFAKLGAKPSARLAAYAALDWARAKAGIDGLTAPEIQEFLSSRLRLKNSYQAYAAALGTQVKNGEVDRIGTKPRIFKLMATGETALAEHVKDLADTKG